MTGLFKKPLAFIASAALILSTALALVLLKDAGSETQPVPAISGRPVMAESVVAVPEVVRLRLPGVIRATERADLAFFHSGQLAERRVRHGQPVKQGEILAVLYNPALLPSVTTAEAKVREINEQLSQIERDAVRLEHLHQRNMISVNEVESIISRRNALRETVFQAETRLGEARQQLAEGQIKAPYDGTVVGLYAEAGQFVPAGRPVVSVVGSKGLEIELNLPAHRASTLVAGGIVMICQIDTGLSTTGVIREIGPASVGRPATIIVDLAHEDSGKWLPGMGIHAELNWHGPPQLLVPLAAIISPGTGRSRVFRVAEGKAELVAVHTGRLVDGHVAVEGHLEAGDRVVVAGHGQLLDGEEIRILP
jgi:RND family efflux transporter MFP subunit